MLQTLIWSKSFEIQIKKTKVQQDYLLYSFGEGKNYNPMKHWNDIIMVKYKTVHLELLIISIETSLLQNMHTHTHTHTNIKVFWQHSKTDLIISLQQKGEVVA